MRVTRLAGRNARRTLAATLLAVLAAQPARADNAPKDPLERLNRATFAFNDAFDRMLARPVAKAYRAVVPAPARRVVGNFLANLSYPTVMLNDALQAKFSDAGSDALRFVANTTIGIGGLFDPATKFGLPIHDEDFGQTLGRWGVPPGPYLMLPFLGPSDVRDAPGRVVDHYSGGDYWLTKTHRTYLNSTTTEYGLYALRVVDTRTALLSTDEALKQAFDRYAVIRNAYVTHREYLVRDGNMPEETYDEPEGEAPAGTASPPPTTQAPPESPPPAAEGAAPAAPVPAPEPPKQPPPEAPTAADATTGATADSR